MFYLITSTTQKAFKTIDEARKAFKKLSYKTQLNSYIIDTTGNVVSED